MPSRLPEIRVEAHNLDLKQPLGRFLILLFRKFEDELIAGLERLNYRDLSSSDLNVLRNIDSQGKTMVEIARLAGVSKQAISKQVQALVEKGYLRISTHDHDKRAVRVKFSKKGEIMIHAAIEIIAGIEHRYSKCLGARNFVKLKQDLLTLIQEERKL